MGLNVDVRNVGLITLVKFPVRVSFLSGRCGSGWSIGPVLLLEEGSSRKALCNCPSVDSVMVTADEEMEIVYS